MQKLKDLEAYRVLARTDYKEVPPRVHYAPTPLGRWCDRFDWRLPRAAARASVCPKCGLNPPASRLKATTP